MKKIYIHDFSSIVNRWTKCGSIEKKAKSVTFVSLHRQNNSADILV